MFFNEKILVVIIIFATLTQRLAAQTTEYTILETTTLNQTQEESTSFEENELTTETITMENELKKLIATEIEKTRDQINSQRTRNQQQQIYADIEEIRNEIEQVRQEQENLKALLSNTKDQIIQEVTAKIADLIAETIAAQLDEKIKNFQTSNQTIQTTEFDESLNCISNCGVAENLPADCEDALKDNATNGVYVLKPLKPVQQAYGVFCTQADDGIKGWTVIQRRLDGSVNFLRNWESYKNGFGNLSSNYWLGLERIHELTSKKKHKLWFKLTYLNGETLNAYYDIFAVGSESEGYSLTIGDFCGDAMDQLTYFNNMKFSTYDKDNDEIGFYNCADAYEGAWWFRHCGSCNLNGEYKPSHIAENTGFYWKRTASTESTKILIANWEKSNLKYAQMAVQAG